MSADQFLQDLLKLPSVMHAKLSPDGMWVAFVWGNVHENRDVFVVPTDGSQPPLALTHTPEYTQLVNWLPDSRAVIVAQDQDGDERDALYRVALDTPEQMQPLTEARPPYFLRGGEVAPDGGSLYYGVNYDFANQTAIEPTWVYRHDLSSGQRTVLAQPAKPNYMQLSLNRTGDALLTRRKDRHPAGTQVHLLDLAIGTDRELLNFGDAHKVYAYWLYDSQQVVFISESTDGQPQNHISVGVHDCSSGITRWLIDDPARAIEWVRVTPDGAVVVDEVQHASRTSSLLDVATGVETPFPHLPGNLIPLGRTPTGEWVALYYAANQPTELVRFAIDAEQPEQLVSLTRVWERTAVQPQQLAAAESVTWASSDRLAVQGWLYRAAAPTDRAVIFVHGGPTSHSESKLNTAIQYYVSQGFNVLDVNYRGSTGFGLAYRESIKEDGWGGREQDDITAAAEYLLAEGLAAPGKIGVTGTSYGGYSAWCQITRAPRQVIGAAAPICGMTDLVVDYNTTRPDLRPYSEEMIGGRPDEIPDKYQERSPINFVEQIEGALLIVQGGQDPNVSPENVREVVKQLHLHDIPYEMTVFDDEGHGIIKAANQAHLYAQIATFFNQAFE